MIFMRDQQSLLARDAFTPVVIMGRSSDTSDMMGIVTVHDGIPLEQGENRKMPPSLIICRVACDVVELSCYLECIGFKASKEHFAMESPATMLFRNVRLQAPASDTGRKPEDLTVSVIVEAKGLTILGPGGTTRQIDFGQVDSLWPIAYQLEITLLDSRIFRFSAARPRIRAIPFSSLYCLERICLPGSLY